MEEGGGMGEWMKVREHEERTEPKRPKKRGIGRRRRAEAGQQEGMKEGCDQKAVWTLDAISDPMNQGANKCEVSRAKSNTKELTCLYHYRAELLI